MERFFTIPELVDRSIWFITDKATLSRASRVCRSLSEPALNALWFDLESILPLVQLLGELVMKINGAEYSYPTLDFANPLITLNDWETYQRYSPRVKAIILNFDAGFFLRGRFCQLSPLVFGTISLTQPRGLNLLPNARRITLCPTPNTAIFYFPFLGRSEHNLDLIVETTDDNELFRYTMSELCSRINLATLNSLRIDTDACLPGFEDAVITFLSEAINLRDISLPSSFLTTQIFGAVSRLQFLDKLFTIFCDTDTPLQKLGDSGFSSLTKLAINSTLESLLPFFADGSWAPQLSEIEVYSPNSSSQSLRDFGSIIGQRRPYITSLHLDLSMGSFAPTPFQNLLGFLDCNQLQSFVLNRSKTCIMNEQDLEKMLHHWPQLKEISLPHGYSVSLSQHCFLFDTLNMFAQLCPNIEKIGLPFQEGGTPVWPLHLHLPRLRELKVGWATPGDVDELALYLANICGGNLEIVNIGPDITKQYGPSWSEVRRLYKLAQIKKRMLVEDGGEGYARPPGWHVVSGIKPALVRGEGHAHLTKA